MVKRKAISWSSGEQRVKELRTQPYRSEPEDLSDPETIANLIPGNMWFLRRPCVKEDYGRFYKQHDAYYLVEEPYRYIDKVFPTGEPAIYLGQLRVVETTPGGKQLTIQRHMFLIRGNRYIFRSLDSLTYDSQKVQK